MSFDLKTHRKSLGLTMLQVADYVGVSEATISRWESGNIANMRRDRIAKLAQILKVSPTVLMQISDDETETEASPDADLFRTVKAIPKLGRVAAGFPIFAEQNYDGYVYSAFDDNEDYFALKVVGDSMTAARIFEGDTVIVRKQSFVEENEIAVVLVNDETATIKRFRQNGSIVTLIPQSFNPVHQPQIYDLKETSLIILGKVVKNEFDIK